MTPFIQTRHNNMKHLRTTINDYSTSTVNAKTTAGYYYDSVSMMEPLTSWYLKSYELHDELSGQFLQYYGEVVPYNHTKINSIVSSIEQEQLPTIRDMLYRMNTVDPIERENINRGFKQSLFTEAPHNYNSEYLSVGRDDTTIPALMNHEIVSILMYLLRKNNFNLSMRYNLHRLFLMCLKISTSSIKRNNRKNLLLHNEPSLRYLLLQSIYDETFRYKLKYNNRYSNDDIKKMAMYMKDKIGAFGSLSISPDITISIDSFVLSRYNKIKYGRREISYNLNQYPMFHGIKWIYKTDHYKHYKAPTQYGYLFVDESFRRVFKNTTVVIQQLLMFGFIDYLVQLLQYNNDDMVLSNPIDEKLWRNRFFQHTLLLAESKYNIVKCFREYLVKEGMLCD